ncbi:MAG: hypothetical protein ACE5FO_06015 [Parvularculaceae bacterium]
MYFQEQHMLVPTRSVLLQIITYSGQLTTLSWSSVAFTMREDFATAKKAMATFLEYYHRIAPNADVVLGFPPTKTNIALWVSLTVGALGYTLYAMRREGMMATQLEFVTFAGLALFMSLAMTWHFWKNTGAKCKSARDLAEELSG